MRKVDHDEARRLRAEGLTLRQIGERFGVSAQRVGQIVGPLGSGRRGPRASWDLDEAIRLRVEEGLTYREIAERMGVTGMAIHRKLRDRVPGGRVPRHERAEMRKRYAAGGVTQAELARDYGYTQAYVSRIVRGVRRPTRA